MINEQEIKTWNKNTNPKMIQMLALADKDFKIPIIIMLKRTVGKGVQHS